MPLPEAPAGDPPLAAGSSFGRYIVEALAGTGGMGHVYRARDTRLDRSIALKLLVAARADAAAWREATARMLREARAAAAFDHPNAVHIYDVGEIDGTPYIAMEFVRGRLLRDFVGDAAVPWEQRLRWLVDAAGALAAAHEAGLVHRDVKPRNVMVGDDGRVKVLDFGIARRVTGEAGQGGDPTLTTEGVVVGTMHYMPPEQLAGGPIDGRTDQFAWAVMAYELFAGERPWPRQFDLVAAVTAILSTPPAPLEELAPYLPTAVTWAIHKALSKLPAERFDSMGDLVGVLEPYATPPVPHASGGHTSVPSGPSTGSARARAAVSGSSASRRRAPETAEGIPPSAVPTVQTRSARGVTVEGKPSRPPLRGRVGLLALAAVAVLGSGAGLERLTRRAAAVPAPAPSSSAVSVLDLPAPASSSPLALTAFREGVQADHDANVVVARADYLEAIGDDPGFGAAHLRFAIDDFTYDVVLARAHFLKAQQLRASLGERDRMLVDALAPLFDESPSDWSEADRRVEAAVHDRSRDAELRYLLGWMREVEGKLPEATTALDQAMALDPTYAAPLDALIMTRQLEGDVPGVVAAGDACIKAVPSAAGCLKDRLWTYAQEGMCSDYERDARHILAIDPGNGESYEDLGQLVLARGQPVDGAWESFRMGWQRQPADYAAWIEADDRSRAAVVLGDAAAFDAAQATMTALNDKQTDQWSHFEQAELLVNELTELGAVDRAARAADDFLHRKAVWTMEPGINAWTLSSDDVPLMLGALLRAGRISKAELDARREEWIESWRKRLAPAVARYLWIFAYAEIAETPAAAAEALARLPEFAPIPRHLPWRFLGARIGHMYLLAGRVDDALAMLERAPRECEPFEEPFTWVQSSLWLGEAREARGNADAACADYASITRRWAGFGSRSVTAAEARRRMAALKCPK